MADSERVWSGRFVAADRGVVVHVDVDGPDPLRVVSLHRPGDPEPMVIDGRVEDGVWRGEQGDVRVEVDEDGCRLTRGSGHPETLTRQSPSFRDLEITLCFEPALREGRDFALGFDQGAAGPTTGRFDLALALDLAGIATTLLRSSAAPDPISHAQDQVASWSDLELHDAMVVHWLADGPRTWALWGLVARLHERGSGLAGLMFDGPSSPDEAQRQGLAVFTQASLHRGHGRSRDDRDRNHLFTLVHEVGHALNLAHSWQKDESVPEIEGGRAWRPMRSDPQARSWMNYPHRVGATAFWADFGFRFGPEELLFLRHGPEQAVVMGGRPFFVDHGLVDARQTLPVDVQVQGVPEFELYEPMHLSVQLHNSGGRSLDLLVGERPPEHVLRVVLEEPDALSGETRLRIARPYVRALEETRLGPLGHGQTCRADLFIGGEPGGGALFREPATAVVRVAVVVDGELQGLSGPLQITVGPSPVTHARLEEAAAAIQSEWGARLYRFEGSVVLPGVRVGSMTLAEALDILAGESDVMRRHRGRLIEGAGLAARRRFDGDTLRIVPPDPKALSALEAFLDDRGTWDRSPAFARRVADRALAADPRPDRKRTERWNRWDVGGTGTNQREKGTETVSEVESEQPTRGPLIAGVVAVVLLGLLAWALPQMCVFTDSCAVTGTEAWPACCKETPVPAGCPPPGRSCGPPATGGGPKGTGPPTGGAGPAGS